MIKLRILLLSLFITVFGIAMSLAQSDLWDWNEAMGNGEPGPQWGLAGGGESWTATTFLFGASYRNDAASTFQNFANTSTGDHDGFYRSHASNQTGVTVYFEGRVLGTGTTFNAFGVGIRDRGGDVGFYLNQTSCAIGRGSANASDPTIYTQVASSDNTVFHSWRIVVPAHSTTSAPQLQVYKDENSTPFITLTPGTTAGGTGGFGLGFGLESKISRGNMGQAFGGGGNAGSQTGFELGTSFRVEVGPWSPTHAAVLLAGVDWWDWNEQEGEQVNPQIGHTAAGPHWCFNGGGAGPGGTTFISSSTFVWGGSARLDARDCVGPNTTFVFLASAPHDGYTIGTAMNDITGYTALVNLKILTTGTYNCFGLAIRDGGGDVGVVFSDQSVAVVEGVPAAGTAIHASAQYSTAGDITTFHTWRIVVPSHSTTTPPQVAIYKDENTSPFLTGLGFTNYPAADNGGAARPHMGNVADFAPNAPSSDGAEMGYIRFQTGAWAPGHTPLLTDVPKWNMYTEPKR